jgi:hypothetical protein
MIENYDKLEYTRKVDVLVAMHVMKWKDIIIQEVGQGSGITKYACRYRDRSEPQGHIPLYSTLLTSAWDVVRKFDYMYLFRSHDFKKGQWECKLRDDRGSVNTSALGKHYGWAETEMLAICYAGLKAVDFDLQLFLKEEKKDGVA